MLADIDAVAEAGTRGIAAINSPQSVPVSLQSGTYVFVFTDLVNSTHLTFSLPPDLWRRVRDRFFAVQDQISRAHRRVWLSPRGDGKFLVFANAVEAAAFAAALLPALAETDWEGVPIAIRIGMASGYAEYLPTEEGGVTNDFVGNPLNTAARICSIARPGEALAAMEVCADVQNAAGHGLDFVDLGDVELKGLPSQRVFRLVAPGLQQNFPPIAQRGNLDQYRAHSQYFGRQETVSEALALLAGSAGAGGRPAAKSSQPVLTLLGEPGQGKTRLSLEVGREALDLFLDGVWFVPLEHVREGDLVAEAVVEALSLTVGTGRDSAQTVVQHLKARHVLLILDNCEQLLADLDADPGLPDFIENLVRSCPRLRILATSRLPMELGASLERMLRMPDLPVPPEQETNPEALLQYPSVALLCDRLNLASGGRFVLDEDSAPHVVSLCRSLDGVPLYLELAAGQLARARTLPQISSDVFNMLQTRDRGYADRQRTLDKLLDFSCDLLLEEREFFYRLGVFRGTFRAEDAAAVCGRPDAEHRLHTLVLHSLVKSDAGDNYAAKSVRYRLLQAPAAFGRRRLGDAAAQWQGRHAEYYLDFARKHDAMLKGPKQKQAADEMADALPNFRAAMDWALEAGEHHMVGEYGSALGRFLFIRGLTIEGRFRMAAALESANSAEDQPNVACALSWSATFQRQRGDRAAAQAFEEEALALWRKIGDRSGEAASLNALGVLAQNQGRYDIAQDHYLNALALFQELGQTWGEAQCLYHLGEEELLRGARDLALHYHEQSLALRERIGDRRGLGNSLAALGRIAFSGSDYGGSRNYYERALGIKRELEDPEGEATCLYTLAIISEATGDLDAAQSRFHAAIATYRRLGLRTYEADCLRRLAEVGLSRDDPAAAQASAEQALALFQDLHDQRGIASALTTLAVAFGTEGNYEKATQLAQDALQIRRELGIPDRIAESLFELGRLSRDQGLWLESNSFLHDSLRTFHEHERRHGVAAVLAALGDLFYRCRDTQSAYLLLFAACRIFSILQVSLDQKEYREAHSLLESIEAEGLSDTVSGWKTLADVQSVDQSVEFALSLSVKNTGNVL